MKKVLLPLLVICLLVAGGLYWLHDNLDELVAEAITEYGSAMTKARVGVEHVELKAGNGRGVIQGVFVGNPKGFKSSHALRVDRIEVVVDLGSLTSDAIVVNSLIIDKPDVIYEKADETTNIDAIQKNIAAYLGPQKKAKPGGPRLIVEELTICNATAQASAGFMGGKTVSVPLPDITLRNIGASRGGVTPGELGQEIAKALKAKLSLAANFDRLKHSTGEALDKAGTAVKGLFK